MNKPDDIGRASNTRGFAASGDARVPGDVAPGSWYRLLYQNMLDEVHVWRVLRNDAGEIISWQLVDINPATERSWGMQREHVCGLMVEEIFPSAAPLFMPTVRKIFDEGRPHTWEEYIPDLGQHLRMTSVPLGDYFISTGTDITALKCAMEAAEQAARRASAAADALRHSEARLNLAVRHTRVGLWEVDLRNDRVWRNEGYERLYGEAHQDGSYSWDWWLERIHPEDRDRVWRSMQAVLKGTETSWSCDYRFRLESGGYADVEDRAIIERGENGEAERFLGAMLDTSASKQTGAQLSLLSQAVEQSPVAVKITDPEGTVTYVNAAFEATTGYSRREVLGQNTRILDSGLTPKSTMRELWSTVNAGQTWVGEVQNRKKNGDLYWARAWVAPVVGSTGEVTHHIGITEDITRSKRQEELIRHQAHYDYLTGLPNRLLAIDRLGQLLKEAKRESHEVAVLFMDLDDFKKINDTLGHDVGDKLLIQCALRLAGVLRDTDTIGRLGGDEFIVLLSHLGDSKQVLRTVDKLLEQFVQPFHVQDYTLKVTASVGIAVYPEDGADVSELLRNSDAAMYKAKRTAPNGYAFFTAALNEQVSKRLAIEQQLHDAVKRQEFSVHYQPKIDLLNGKVVGAEALLRWDNPTLGEVGPADFIAIAEQSGGITELGEFVLGEAMTSCARWRAEIDPTFRVAINLSPLQIRNPLLVDYLETLLTETGVAPDALEVEVTEGILLQLQSEVEACLQGLLSLGVTITMDDFGTGYSSLGYLRRYKFEALKIDQSFVADISSDASDRQLIRAAIAMAHGLNMQVVAEGVETREQHAFLRDAGCDFGQGYLYSEPMPAENMEGYLRSRLP